MTPDQVFHENIDNREYLHPMVYRNPMEAVSHPKSPAYIDTKSKTLIVGPGVIQLEHEKKIRMLPMDMGVIVLPFYLKPPADLSVLGLSLEQMNKYGGGKNNIPLLEQTLNEINNQIPDDSRISFCPVTFIQDEVTDYANKNPNAYDAVWDHITWPNLIDSPVYPDLHGIRWENTPYYVLSHYLRLINRKGKLLLWGNDKENTEEVEEVHRAITKINQTSNEKYSIRRANIQNDQYPIPPSLTKTLGTYFSNDTHVQRYVDPQRSILVPYYKANFVLAISRTK